jgi:hypothetical protein
VKAMNGKETNWNICKTLSKQIRQGRSVAKEFRWNIDLEGQLTIKSSQTKQTFSKEDYKAMISHVSANPNGVPLGSRRDGDVPKNSIGALMERRTGTSGIRGWCSHLAAIAVARGDIEFYDKGRGPGNGIWLYPKNIQILQITSG